MCDGVCVRGRNSLTGRRKAVCRVRALPDWDPCLLSASLALRKPRHAPQRIPITSKLLNPVEYFQPSQSSLTRLSCCFYVKPSPLSACGPLSWVRLPCADRPPSPVLRGPDSEMGAGVTQVSAPGPFLTFSGFLNNSIHSLPSDTLTKY